MTLHLQERLDLADCQVFPVTKCDQLIEGAEQLVGILEDFPLVQALARGGNNLGKEMKRVNVLEDVGLAIGDEDHVQLIQRLVDKADVVLFDGRMLRATVCKLGEGGKEGFDARPGHLAELSRKDSFASTGADRCCEDDLEDSGSDN